MRVPFANRTKNRNPFFKLLNLSDFLNADSDKMFSSYLEVQKIGQIAYMQNLIGCFEYSKYQKISRIFKMNVESEWYFFSQKNS